MQDFSVWNQNFFIKWNDNTPHWMLYFFPEAEGTSVFQALYCNHKKLIGYLKKEI